MEFVRTASPIAEEKEQEKALELFSSNSKESEIVTFEERLQKVKHIHAFLSLDHKDATSADLRPGYRVQRMAGRNNMIAQSAVEA